MLGGCHFRSVVEGERLNIGKANNIPDDGSSC